MNSSIPSVLTRSRRRLVVLLIAVALTALALACILSGTTARGASNSASHLATPGGMVVARGEIFASKKRAPDAAVAVDAFVGRKTNKTKL